MNETRDEEPSNRDGTGRPSELDRTITVPGAGPGTGRTMTVADRLVELHGLGYTPRRAASRVGIRIGVLDRWQRTAGKAEIRLAAYYTNTNNHHDPDQILTPHETLCIRFCARFDEAWATYIGGLQSTMVQLARGGIARERVVEKYERLPDGALGLVDRSVTSEATLPDRQAIEFLLRAAAPGEFVERVRVEAGVGEGLDAVAAAETLSATIDAFLLGAEAERASRSESAERLDDGV